MILNLTELSSQPLDEQIAAQLLRRILSGDVEPGHVLPPARTLARRQRVGVSSVRRAYTALEREGVIRRITRNGVDEGSDDRYAVAAISRAAGEEIRRRWFEGPAADLAAELATARQIQADLLPKRLPDGPGLRFSAYSMSSLAVGGDFYDVIPLDGQRIAVVIADASGKGLSAAMMISQLHGMFRSEINHGNDIRTTLRHVNDHLAAFSGPDRFATVFYGIFDRSTGVLEFANAGHNHPLLVRADGRSEPLDVGGTILGMFPGADFTTATAVLEAGDVLFLYTDGVTETRNASDEEYGETRLLELLRRHRDRSADEVMEAVLGDLAAFQATEPLQDDRTCLVLRAEDVAARVL